MTDVNVGVEYIKKYFDIMFSKLNAELFLVRGIFLKKRRDMLHTKVESGGIRTH